MYIVISMLMMLLLISFNTTCKTWGLFWMLTRQNWRQSPNNHHSSASCYWNRRYLSFYKYVGIGIDNIIFTTANVFIMQVISTISTCTKNRQNQQMQKKLQGRTMSQEYGWPDLSFPPITKKNSEVEIKFLFWN